MKIQLQVPAGYRHLNVGERIVYGDKFCSRNNNLNKWNECHTSVGTIYNNLQTPNSGLNSDEYIVITNRINWIPVPKSVPIKIEIPEIKTSTDLSWEHVKSNPGVYRIKNGTEFVQCRFLSHLGKVYYFNSYGVFQVIDELNVWHLYRFELTNETITIEFNS